MTAMEWPYDEDPAVSPAPAPAHPTWECPDDSCACGAVRDDDPEDIEFAVMLLDPLGKRMAGAACRMTYQGRVVNEDHPNADGAGWVLGKVPRTPATVLVEWAPAHKPRDPGFPYRCMYYVDLDKDRTEAARRRLHNLGYRNATTLRENVAAFQRDHGYKRATGEVDDVWDDLVCYHDEGRYPEPGGEPKPIKGSGEEASTAESGDPGSERAALVPITGPADRVPTVDERTKLAAWPDLGDLFGGDDDVPTKASPQDKTDAPKNGGNQVSTGTCKMPADLPTLEEVITAGTAIYQFERVFREVPGKDDASTMRAHFWILAEALMWEVPKEGPWSCWTDSVSGNPYPMKPRGMTRDQALNINRRRLCRLPCSGEEAMWAADNITITQAELHESTLANLDELGTFLKEWYPPTSEKALPSLLPTPELFDQLYLDSDIKFANTTSFIKVKPNSVASNQYNNRLDKLIGEKWGTIGTVTSSKQGNCGKIWALGPGMNTVRYCKGFDHWDFATINHGFYKGTSKASDLIQAKGMCHNWKHKDYSQIFICVAGWCLLKEAGGDWGWAETSRVFSEKALAPLVRIEPVGLSSLAYRGATTSEQALIDSNNANGVKP